MTNTALAIDHDERKRLGQYFTGAPLASVLAALGSAHSATSLLDPMAGSGDMLIAALSVGAAGSPVTAVEIDPLASSTCAQRLRSSEAHADVRTADAFAPSTWSSDAGRSWDLVITNPPYVRYQRTARSAAGRFAIPSATEVRRGLLEIINSRDSLSVADRGILRVLVEGYSGLADLAVPSWLLCAALVAPEGRLAMVVPDTWLTRDYAMPVLYLLRRCFDIEFVVEDGEAAWFEDALVRTTLVVARRVPTRPTALTPESAIHVHARLTSDAASDVSLVGSLHPRSKVPERRFAERLRVVARSGDAVRVRGLDAGRADDAQFRDRLLAQAGATSWGKTLEPSVAVLRSGERPASDVPRRLREVVGDIGARLRTLDQLGWSVGQGLRTGANRFFYGEALAVDGDVTEICVDPELSSMPFIVPTDLLRVVVRKQSDLQVADGDAERSPGRVVVLGRHALEEDISATAAGARMPYLAIPEPLASFVRRAARLNVGSEDEPRRLPELSAVITNVRPGHPARPDRPPRFWYQLPPLAARHTGVLFMARINHGHPVAALNRDGVVIDANFSTFWPRDEDALSPFALVALLESTWAVASLEALGTVLGGGALKVEATQLRRLALPWVSETTADALDELGRSMNSRTASDLRPGIDDAVWSALKVSRRTATDVTDARRDLLWRRNRRHRTGGRRG